VEGDGWNSRVEQLRSLARRARRMGMLVVEKMSMGEDSGRVVKDRSVSLSSVLNECSSGRRESEAGVMWEVELEEDGVTFGVMYVAANCVELRSIVD
jgi:hypothetical protein